MSVAVVRLSRGKGKKDKIRANTTSKTKITTDITATTATFLNNKIPTTTSKTATTSNSTKKII